MFQYSKVREKRENWHRAWGYATRRIWGKQRECGVQKAVQKKKKCLKNKMKTYMNGTARLTKWKFSHWTEKHEEY